MNQIRESFLNNVTNNSPHKVEPVSKCVAQPISEIIASYMINKLISYSLVEVQNQGINNLIPNHCFDFIKNSLNNMVHLTYVAYDRDDFYPIEEPARKTEEFNNDQQFPDNIFFDNVYYGQNQWIDIPEPKKTKIDRAASTLIKVNKSTFNTSMVQNHSSQTNLVVINDVKDKGESLSTSKIIVDKSKEIHIPTSPLKDGNSSASNLKLLQKRIVDFDQWDLEDVKNFVEDNVIVCLREEKKKEIKRKEEEVQIKKNIEQNKDPSGNKIEKVRILREFDGKKYTFDVDGAVINIRGLPPERLLNNFSAPKYEIKVKKESNINDFITTNSSANTNSPVKEKKIKESIKNPNPSSPQKDHTQKNIIKVEEDLNRRQSMIKYPVRNNYNNTKDNDRYGTQGNAITQPAGSNFDLIFPEIGVTITEGIKKKGGDNDFFRKYQKYSKYDYTNLLKESMPTNKFNSVSINIDDISHPQLSLPLLNSQDLTSSFAVKATKSIIKLPTHTSIGNKMSASLLSQESMKISNKLTTSLKNTLEHLDYIPEYEEDEHILNNLGGEIMSTKANKKDLQLKEQNDKSKDAMEAINKFNLSIIRNSSWGTNSAIAALSKENKNEPPVKKHKPHHKELEKEMGRNIVNTKLPRSRIFNLNKSVVNK